MGHMGTIKTSAAGEPNEACKLVKSVGDQADHTFSFRQCRCSQRSEQAFRTAKVESSHRVRRTGQGSGSSQTAEWR